MTCAITNDKFDLFEEVRFASQFC